MGKTAALIGILYICTCACVSADVRFMITDPTSGEPILPTSNITMSEENNQDIEIVASKGEYEPASVVLLANKRYKEKFEISVKGFSGSAGEMSNDDIDVRYVLPWFQAAGAWGSHRIQHGKDPVLVPELLVKDPELVINDINKQTSYLKTYKKNGSHQYVNLRNSDAGHDPMWNGVEIKDAERLQPIALKKGLNQQIWLTANVAKEVTPGIHRGFLLLKSGSYSLEIPISITVLPFELAESSLTYSLYYRGRLDPGTTEIFSEYKDSQQLTKEMENIKEHGVCCPTLYQRYVPKTPRELEHNTGDMIVKHLDIREKTGVDNSNLYYLGLLTTSSKKWRVLDEVGRNIAGFNELIASHGVKNTYIYGREEVRTGDLKDQERAWGSAKKNGAKVFVAGYEGHVETMEGKTDLLIYHDQIERNISDQVHSYNNLIFSYSNPQSGTENPSLFRKNYGYWLLLNNFDGAMIYSYQHGFGDIWNDFDGEIYRDLVLAYPVTNGVIDTIAWEGVREAIDDVRYFSTYEAMLMQGGEVQAARDFLENKFDTTSNISDLNSRKMRSEIIAKILGLSPEKIKVTVEKN